MRDEYNDESDFDALGEINDLLGVVAEVDDFFGAINLSTMNTAINKPAPPPPIRVPTAVLPPDAAAIRAAAIAAAGKTVVTPPPKPLPQNVNLKLNITDAANSVSNKLLSLANAAATSAAKLRTAAQKSKHPNSSSRLKGIASGIDKKVSSGKTQAAQMIQQAKQNSLMGDVLPGIPDAALPGIFAGVVAGVNALIAQLGNVGTEADALAAVSDINDQLVSYVTQFKAIKNDAFAADAAKQQATAAGIIAGYPTDGSSQPAIMPATALLEMSFNNWKPGADAAIAAGPAAPPPGPPVPPPVPGQATLTKAMGVSDLSAALSNTMGMLQGTVLQIDNEQMLVTSVVSPLQVNVQRAYSQTGAQASPSASHAAGAAVMILSAQPPPSPPTPPPSGGGFSGGGGGSSSGGGGDSGGGDDGGGADDGGGDDGGGADASDGGGGGGGDGGGDSGGGDSGGDGGGSDAGDIPISPLEEAAKITGGDFDTSEDDADSGDGGDTEAGALPYEPCSSGFDYFGGEEFVVVGHGHGGGGGGGGHGHGGHGHGGYRGGGGPWWYGDDYDGLELLDVEDGIDVDAIANAVARKIEEHKTSVGYYDIGTMQKQMNMLKAPISVAQAKELLKGGQLAIDAARTAADDGDLPGGTARDNVYWKLKWHEDALKKASAPVDDTLYTSNNLKTWAADVADIKAYASGDDLKKWVMQAFIEGNATQTGLEWESTIFYKIWGDMWESVKHAVTVIIQKIEDAGKAAGGVLSTIGTYLKWGSIVLGIGVIGVGGYAGYRRISGR